MSATMSLSALTTSRTASELALKQSNNILDDVNQCSANLSFQQTIDELRSKEENASTTMLGDEMRASKELEAFREYFSKLKFNFVELETKQGFLAQLAQGKRFDELPSQEEVEQLEGVVGLEKNSVQMAKTANKDMREEIESLAESVEQRWSEFQEEYKSYYSLHDELKALDSDQSLLWKKNDLDDMHEDVPMYLEEAVSLARSEATAAMNAFNSAEQERGMNARLSAKQETLKTDISTLLTDVAATTTAAGQALSKRASDAVELQEMGEWYDSLLSLSAILNGVVIRTPINGYRCSCTSHCSCSCSFSLGIGASETPLDLRVRSINGALLGAHIHSVTIDVHDIVKYVIAQESSGRISYGQGIHMLIAEAKMRLANVERVAADVTLLQDMFAVDWISKKGSHVLNVILKPNVRCELMLIGHPNSSTPTVNIKSITGIDLNSEDGCRLQTEIVNMKNLSEAVTLIQKEYSSVNTM